MDTKDTAETTAPSVAPAKPALAPKPAGEPEPEKPVPSVPLSGLGDDSLAPRLLGWVRFPKMTLNPLTVASLGLHC